MFRTDQQVHHPEFGTGSVIVGQGDTVVVRFEHGIESCETGSLTLRLGVADAVKLGRWSPPLDVTLKAQAAAIRSLNDSWGVFSRSLIDLLPHQLWVCHRALQKWPIRLLIADDVGLGKTVEAGLILSPLISRKKVGRLLILAPASLVEQWQYRLRTLFDIRTTIYRREVDRPRADYWSTHPQVVASLQTLRLDRAGRHERLLEAPPWDMLIVDEAHHLNADEQTGKTLGYEFVERLVEEKLVESCLFFTGTPHRGKLFGFWSLMKLLQPDVFGPDRLEREQLPRLRQFLIRNFKNRVTDMAGNRLFQPVNNDPQTYEYSDAERKFYDLLTRFILAGNAYASGLQESRQRQVSLVLIAMQKIASSSVAAIRAALARRVRKLKKEVGELVSRELDLPAGDELDLPAGDEEDPEVVEAFNRWANQEANQKRSRRAKDELSLRLLEDELPHLEKLLDAASLVEEESKIKRIGEIIDRRYRDRSILLFTEYKATQALMVSTLMARFGEDRVGFINGDDRLEGVRRPSGDEAVLSERREATAEAFNRGRIQFLVSTEAGGEGIDLHERCHTLIHVDLPWNPMRLHQRVGRLHRYGQKNRVDVVTIRNPSTVESRIWDKLETKLARITEALAYAMGEPEDLMQMVLGMADPRLFNELFAGGESVGADRLEDWFDARTRSLGGESAIEAVTNLVGNCQSFDLSELDDVPRKDLPDLEPFFYGALVRNGRRPDRREGSFSFLTPDAWLGPPGVRPRYDDLIFRRKLGDEEEAKQIVGVGHQVFDQALSQAVEFEGGLAVLRDAARPLAVFQIQDAVTIGTGHLRQVVVGVEEDGSGELALLRDEQVLDRLNRHKPGRAGADGADFSVSSDSMLAWLERARDHASGEVGELRLPFRKALVSDLALFWPPASAG